MFSNVAAFITHIADAIGNIKEQLKKNKVVEKDRRLRFANEFRKYFAD